MNPIFLLALAAGALFGVSLKRWAQPAPASPDAGTSASPPPPVTSGTLAIKAGETWRLSVKSIGFTWDDKALQALRAFAAQVGSLKSLIVSGDMAVATLECAKSDTAEIGVAESIGGGGSIEIVEAQKL